MSERIDLNNLVPLSQRLGVPKSTIYPWQRGEVRPPWGCVRQIADILNIPLPEAVQALWRDNVGDPCPCGCGFKKTFPDNPQARVLAIEITCAQCGSKQIRGGYARDHCKLCRHCSRSADRVERIEFTCVGFRDYGAIRHAKKCPSTRQLAPYQIKNRELRKKRNPNIVFDALSRTYQSRSCASAGPLLALMEKQLRNFHPRTPRSRNERSARLSSCVNVMHPKFIPDIEKLRNQNRHRPAPGTTIAKEIYWWSRPPKDLPKFVRLGFCVFCVTIAFRVSGAADKPPRWHRRCYFAWKRTPEGKDFQSRKMRGLEASMPRSTLELRVRVPVDGMAGTEDSLKISFSWAVQHYLYTKSLKAKSYRTIAEENGVDHTSVRDRIRFLIDHLPAPELLIPRFARPVRMLLEAASLREASSHSIAASMDSGTLIPTPL